MNELETLTALWKKQETQIKDNLRLNIEALKEIKSHKAKTRLKSYAYLNIFSLIVSIGMIIFGATFIQQNQDTSHLVASGLGFSLWSTLICYGSIVQLKMIIELDFSKSVIQVQSNLRKIQLSALYFLRCNLMVIPMYFCFMLLFVKTLSGVDLLDAANNDWLISQIFLTLFMTLVYAYLYPLLFEKNIDKPLVKFLMQGCGSQAALAAEELNQIRSFVEESAE